MSLPTCIASILQAEPTASKRRTNRRPSATCPCPGGCANKWHPQTAPVQPCMGVHGRAARRNAPHGQTGRKPAGKMPLPAHEPVAVPRAGVAASPLCFVASLWAGRSPPAPICAGPICPCRQRLPERRASDSDRAVDALPFLSRMHNTNLDEPAFDPLQSVYAAVSPRLPAGGRGGSPARRSGKCRCRRSGWASPVAVLHRDDERRPPRGAGVTIRRTIHPCPRPPRCRPPGRALHSRSRPVQRAVARG